MTWSAKKLGQVIEIVYGKHLPKDSRTDSGKYFAYGSNGPVFRTNEVLTNDKVIVIGRKGTAGALYFVDEPCWPIDTTFFAKPKGEVSLKFIYYLLQTKNLPRLAIITGVPGINRTTLGNLDIQLAPLPIQQQIVAKLDKIGGAQKLNADLIRKADELFQVLLHKEFIPANKNWEEKTMGDIAESRSGFGFPLDIQGDKHEELPFYKVSDMNLLGNEIEMRFHNNSISAAKCSELKYNPAPAGSVIFPKIGAAVATNKKRILVRDSLYDNNVMGLIPSELVNPRFLYFWLVKFDISRWASQSMPPSIKKSTVDKHIISIPSFEIQNQIVAKLSAVQNYKNQLLDQQSKLKELFDSVLAKSMRG